MFRKQSLRYVLISIIIIVLLAMLAGYLYLRTSLPQTQGAIRLAGLNDSVEIIRDSDGVPHIFAATDHDAFFALGYVHAQDRLWQMEFQRRVGAGQLSEILGETTLNADKFLRTLGTYRAAESAWPALSQHSQMALQSYADGVNAWLDEGHTLPPEFLILGVQPEPWQPVDSLVWAKMMAWDLGGNYDLELLRVRLTQAIGPERAAELLPPYPETGATILAASHLPPESVESLLSLDTQLQFDLQLRGLDVGSNNWVVSGSLTETGLPMLANDPHLGTRIPSVWYLAEMHGDKLHAIGATLPGLPAIVIGHNENIAWGVTNLGPDVQDLYMEQVNPKNLNQYEVEGEWVEMRIIEEPIYVKDEDEPILWAARSTRHGPLISDVSGSIQRPMALRWTALDAGDTSFNSFLQINYAGNWDEFTTALADYVAPSQNFIYADHRGNIGYYGPGHIPIRVNGDGTLPVPGWNSEYEWIEWIPFEDLPHAYNPASGYIATANNRVVPDDYPYFITHDWTEPYRARRIIELIETQSSNGRKISMDDMAAIQADQHSTQIQELLPLLLNVQPTDDRQAQALNMLKSWDGQTSAGSAAMAIYQAWFFHVGQAIFDDDLSGDLFEDMAERRHPLFLAAILGEPNEVWCDNYLSTPAESCLDIAQEALDRALDDLEERLGEDMSRWQWGDVHRTQYPHNPFSEVDLLKPLFHREISNGGDSYTVNVAPVRFSDPYLQFHVPSYRQITDLSDWNNSLFVHTTGQSGNVLSAHYDDLIERHQAVEYLPMSFGRENVTGQTLTLQPNNLSSEKGDSHFKKK